MFVGVAFQRGDVTVITVTVYHAAISKGSVGKFPHGRLLEVGGSRFSRIICVSIIRQCNPIA